MSSMEEEYRTGSNFICTSILLRAESYAHLQWSSVDMTQEFMSLINQWKFFPWNGSGLDGGHINKKGQG